MHGRWNHRELGQARSNLVPTGTVGGFSGGSYIVFKGIQKNYETDVVVATIHSSSEEVRQFQLLSLDCATRIFCPPPSGGDA